MRAIFRNKNDEWRSGWRIVVFILLLAGAGIAINAAWQFLDLPGRTAGGPWPFMFRAALTAGVTLGIVLLLLRGFERRGADAIWLPFRRSAWGDTIIGTLIGAVPICLLVGLALVGGYGTLSIGDLQLASVAGAFVPMLLTLFFLASWEELFLRGFLMRYVQSPDYRAVSMSQLGFRAMLVAPLYGGLTHPTEAIAAVAWFSLVTWLVARTGKFWDAVIAHGTTNLLLGLYVCLFSQWQLW